MKRMREEEVEDGSRGTRERGCRFCGFRFGLHTRLPVSLTGCLLALHRQQQQQQHHQQRSPPLLSLSHGTCSRFPHCPLRQKWKADPLSFFLVILSASAAWLRSDGRMSWRNVDRSESKSGAELLAACFRLNIHSSTRDILDLSLASTESSTMDSDSYKKDRTPHS